MANVQQCLLKGFTQNAGLYIEDFSGTLVPKELSKYVVDSRGNPDEFAIKILSDVLYWYRPKASSKSTNEPQKKFKEDTWQVSYEYFVEKFGRDHQKIRRTIKKLEDLDLVKREFRTIFSYGRRMNNVMYLHLNIKKVENIISNHSSSIINNDDSYSQIRLDHIKETKNSTKIENNRSMDLASNEPKSGSNFLNLKNNSIYLKGEGSKNLPNDFFVEPVQKFRRNESKTSEPNEHNSVMEKKFKQETKTLSDYLPLNDKLHETLQIKSGRDFSQIAMNEILESVSKKGKDRRFNSKKGFISYAAKVLENEMRQAERVNNRDFKIKTNMTDEEKKSQSRELFLEKIESSRDTSEDTRFKKKIISSFSEQRAYELLKAFKSLDRAGGAIALSFSKVLDISKQEEKILISNALEICDDNDFVENYNIKVHCLYKKQKKPDSKISSSIKLQNNIWGEVRGVLIEKFGHANDKSWFSRLHERIDDKNKSIELLAPTGAMQTWIEFNYKGIIDNILRGLGYRLENLRVA